MTGKSNILDFLGSVQRFIKLNDKENFLDSLAAAMASVGKAECRTNRLVSYVERYTAGRRRRGTQLSLLLFQAPSRVIKEL